MLSETLEEKLGESRLKSPHVMNLLFFATR